jgi:hypothetical protein
MRAQFRSARICVSIVRVKGTMLARLLSISSFCRSCPAVNAFNPKITKRSILALDRLSLDILLLYSHKQVDVWVAGSTTDLASTFSHSLPVNPRLNCTTGQSAHVIYQDAGGKR